MTDSLLSLSYKILIFIWNIVVLPVAKQKGPKVQKMDVSGFFLYMESLLFIWFWWDFFYEFLRKIPPGKCIAVLCIYYRFLHKRSWKGWNSKIRTFLFSSNPNAFLQYAHPVMYLGVKVENGLFLFRKRDKCGPKARIYLEDMPNIYFSSNSEKLNVFFFKLSFKGP